MLRTDPGPAGRIMPDTTAELFQQQRGRLFGIAYRMLSSATDAEDVVQEAFVRWLQAGATTVESPRAYLTTIVVRLCLDHLGTARARREVYVGPWLPEPIATGAHPELVETVVQAESLSFAFLIMLENLRPLERAVFVLREVFDYDYAEIAAIVGKSAANCRQLLHRAQAHLGQRRPRGTVSRAQQERITAQFLRASAGGDIQELLTLLAADTVFTGDGGGQAQAGRHSVQGAEKVARGLLGGLRKMPPDLHGQIAEINGQPAIVASWQGRLYGVVLLDILGDQVRHVYLVVNPDKLRWLGPPPA